MQVKDVLRAKGTDVATISPAATVTELVDALAERKVGAIVVTEADGALEGIVSERDVVRQLQRTGTALLQESVASIMTTDVVTCAPGDDVVAMMGLMTEKRFRHLPVIQDDELAGIVSIGDIVKARVEALTHERDQLQSYIAGS